MTVYPHSLLRWTFFPLSMIVFLTAQPNIVRAGQEPVPRQAGQQPLRVQNPQLRMLQPTPNQNLRIGEVVTLEQINRYLFSQDGSEEHARKRFEIILDREIVELSWVCLLTASQKGQADLAGRGDIVRYFHQCEEFSQRFQGIALSRDALLEIRQETSLLRMKLGMTWTSEHSLLYRFLVNNLSSDQVGRLEALNARRKRAAHLNTVNRLIQTILAQTTLSVDKRQELTNYFLRETHPSPISSLTGYDIYYLLLQVDRQGKDKLKQLLEDTDLDTLERLIETAHSIEPRLRTLGYFQDEDEIGAAPATTKK